MRVDLKAFRELLMDATKDEKMPMAKRTTNKAKKPRCRLNLPKISIFYVARSIYIYTLYYCIMSID